MENPPKVPVSPLEKETLSWVPFDAKIELQNIRRAPKALWREKVWEFKKEFLKQKEGIGIMIRRLQNIIERTPDVEKVYLKHVVREEAEKYRLTQAQLEDFSVGIAEYERLHKAVKKYDEQYPEDRDLFRACFGKDPMGKVIISKGPMTLFFRCFDIRDYIRIYDYKKTKDIETINPEEYPEAGTTLGAILHIGAAIPELQGAITARNSSNEGPGEDNEQSVRDTYIHEEQHQWNSLFQPDKKTLQEILEQSIDQTTSEEPKGFIEEVTSNVIRMKVRNRIDMKAHDEILAYYREGTALATIERWLTKDSLYNYVSEESAEIKKMKEEMSKEMGEEFREAISAIDVEEFVDKTIKAEYYRDLKNWLRAIVTLEEKRYGKKEIISLLYQDPPKSWPALARRARVIVN